MKSSSEKSSTTTSATVAQASNQPFFGKAGGGNFFAPASPTGAPAVQMKMMVNQPGDKFEQEADKMASKVMRMSVPATDDKIQKKDDDRIQKAPVTDEKLQKKEEDKIQRKSSEGAPEIGASIQAAILNKSTGGQPLPSHVRIYMESRFGVDFSKVRVHTDPEAAHMCRDLQAQAFTYKQNIFYGAGKSPANDALTAHELTHVVQQMGGMRSGAGIIQRDPTDPTEEKKDDDSLTDKFLQRLGPFGISLGNDGRVYFYLSRFTMLNGRARNESVPISETEIESPPIPLEIPGLAATVCFKFKLSAEVAYILDPVVLTNIRLGMSKKQASVFLAGMLSPLAGLIVFSPELFFIPILLGRPPIWLREARGTAQIQTGGSANAGIAFVASGEASINVVSKKLKLLALEAGVSGSIGGKISAGAKVEGLAMIIEGGHLKMRHRRNLDIRAGVYATLSAFLEASALGGLIKKRFTRNWSKEKDIVNIDLSDYNQGEIDVDYDNGLTDEKKLIQLDGQKIKKAIGIVAKIKDLFGKSEKEESTEVSFKTKQIAVELGDDQVHHLLATNEEDNTKAIVYLRSTPEEFSVAINTELNEIIAERIQLESKQRANTITGAELNRLKVINGDVQSLLTIKSSIKGIENKINLDLNAIIRGASKESESEAFIERRKAFTEAELNDIAFKNRSLLKKLRFKHTSKFFKEMPDERHIPGEDKGGTIRTVLYDNMHNWKSHRATFFNRKYTPLIKKITDAQDAANQGLPKEWDELVKSGLYIEKGAIPATYNPNRPVVSYEVDHIVPVSKLWNSGGLGFPAGFDAINDKVRGDAFLLENNLRLITAQKNQSLAKEAPDYKTFVGPNFRSMRAENNSLKAKTFNGDPFVDRKGNKLSFD